MTQDKKDDARTVFVRGVNYVTGDSEFAEFFSSIGPVKTAFLVKTDGQKGHKGFGFVQYAMEEDAERAIKEFNGAELDGKKLKVESALRRASFDDRKKRKRSLADGDEYNEETDVALKIPTKIKKKVIPAPPPSAETVPYKNRAAGDASTKHIYVRTIAIGGLTAVAALDAALEKAASCGKVETIVRQADADIVNRHKLAQDGCTGKVALVTFSSVKEALDAVAALHGQNVKPGSKGQARVWARQLSGEGLHIKRWRLVVRNLSFKASEEDLRKAFSPAGFVWEVKVPRGADGNSRGFAFVGYQCKADAERAIKAVNATVIAGRPVAVDWALSKREYDAAVAQQGEPGIASDDDNDDDDDSAHLDSDLERESEEEEEEEEERGAGPRKIIGHEINDADVDMAPEEERNMLHGVLDDILGQDEETHNKKKAKKGEDGGKASNDLFSRSNLATSQSGQEALQRLEEQQQRREQLNAQRAAQGQGGGTAATVFIRGLPLDVVKDQVWTTLKTFGPLRACRLVMDKNTGKPKGTAFVEFREEKYARAAANACARGRTGDGLGVLIAGRRVDVDPALDVEGVRKLAVDKSLDYGPGGKDKRNTYLAKEGQIMEGSTAWEEMSVADRTKRKHGMEEAQAKLKNPNYLVSATRLSIRNIPKGWDEKKLKALFVSAVKERAAKAKPKVVQTKILTGEQGTSKGIGFLEFDDHEHALCALRQLNNNPKPWGKDRRPIIEFAFDDARILQKRKARLAHSSKAQQQQQQQQGEDAGPHVDIRALERPASNRKSTANQQNGDGPDSDDSNAPAISKRKLRKERRVMLKQRAAATQQADSDDDGGDNKQVNETVSKAKAKRRRHQRAAKRGRELSNAEVDGDERPVKVETQPVAKKMKKAAPVAAVAEEQAKGKAKKPDPAKAVAVAVAPASGRHGKAKAVEKQSGTALTSFKPRRRKNERDGLDKIVDNYVKKLAGGKESGSKKTPAAAKAKQQEGGLKRWFD